MDAARARRPILVAPAAKRGGAAMRWEEEEEEVEASFANEEAQPRRGSASLWSRLTASCLGSHALPVTILSLLTIWVIGRNVMRDMQRDWEPCDANSMASRMAKHFYCYNASMPPGVHTEEGWKPAFQVHRDALHPRARGTVGGPQSADAPEAGQAPPSARRPPPADARPRRRQPAHAHGRDGEGDVGLTRADPVPDRARGRLRVRA